MTRHRRTLLAIPLAPLVFFLFGFDLDRGELRCEQAASHLEECCPDLEMSRLSCIQKGGCNRPTEGTHLTMEESDCIRDASCDDIQASMICERIQDRADSIVDDGPTLADIRAKDPLCD